MPFWSRTRRLANLLRTTLAWVGELHHSGPLRRAKRRLSPKLGASASLSYAVSRVAGRAMAQDLTFLPFLFALAATVAITLLLALLTASTGTGSSPVALGEDHLTPQASLVTSGCAAGMDFSILDSVGASAQCSASHCRECQDTYCGQCSQCKCYAAHGALL